MKKFINLFLISTSVLLATIMLSTCDDDGYSLGDYWIELATVYPSGSDWYYLTLDDGTTLWPAAPLYKPANLKYNERAWVNFTILSDSISGFSHYVKVNDISYILTKDIAEDLGTKNDSVYGTAPVKMYEPWIGDGFLNVQFQFNAGGEKSHFINLIRVADPRSDSPYVFEFRHNAYNDPERFSQMGLVAFNLNSIDTGGKDVKLIIKVRTFDGDKEISITYNSNQKHAYMKHRIKGNEEFAEIK